MKRLLIVINDANFFNTTRLPAAIAAKDAGYDVHVASNSSTEVQKIIAHGITHHTLRISRSGKNPFAECNLLIKTIRLFNKLNPDIVHCVTIKPSLYGGIAARLTHRPSLVIAISGLGTIFLDSGFRALMFRAIVVKLYKMALGHKNCITIFQNPSDQKLLIDTEVIDEKNTRLIKGSGIDLTRFIFTPEPEGKPKILFAARLLKDKGIHEFVEAAKLTIASGFDVEFVIAGDIDPDNPTSITQLEKEKITHLPYFKILGMRSDMEKIYAQATIVVLPSYREGLPRVLCEAAACGRATITTDVPGCRDAIIDGETGKLVAVRDSHNLAKAIKCLIQDQSTRRAMAQAGRKLAEQSFDVNSVAAAHMAVYAEVSTKA